MSEPLCECGCGLPAPLAKRTDPRSGHVKGEPCRFRKGHKTKAVGRFISVEGYVMVRAPEHPKASRGYICEHILVVEKALGHYLPEGAEVHHFDENKQRNVGGNFVACEDRGYHALLHQRQRALAATGNPSAHRCGRCGSYDRQDEIRLVKRSDRGTFTARHRGC